MHASKIKVLLIRESQNTYSPLTDHLRRGGCECCFAASKREAGLLLDNNTFDLVLGPIRLKSESLYLLIGLLDGSLTTLFYSQAVEHGCWWLPALRRGQNCFGAPAFRPGEFVTVLDAIIAEIRSSMRVAAEAQPHIASQHFRFGRKTSRFPQSATHYVIDQRQESEPRSAESLGIGNPQRLRRLPRPDKLCQDGRSALRETREARFTTSG
jgi:hypothetical protein